MRSLFIGILLLLSLPLAAQDIKTVTACTEKEKLLVVAMLFADKEYLKVEKFFENNQDVCFRMIELPFPFDADKRSEPLYRQIYVLQIVSEGITYFVPVMRADRAFVSLG